jgi:hypothetical protein
VPKNERKRCLRMYHDSQLEVEERSVVVEAEALKTDQAQ